MMENPVKLDDLGVPLFLETPNPEDGMGLDPLKFHSTGIGWKDS